MIITKYMKNITEITVNINYRMKYHNAVAVTSNLLKALPFSSVSLNLQFTTLRQECLTVATYTI